MSTNQSRSDGSRYDELEIANGDVVVYDTENHRAWIQSDGAISREEMA